MFTKMAANLNPPSHYASNSENQQSSGGLIPPSEYEKPKSEDPWKALGQATSEILELRQQNLRLSESRHVTLPVGDEIKARVDVHHAEQSPSPHVHTFETLINRQAEEIVALKSQLSQYEGAYQKQLNQLESQLMLKDSQHLQELTLLRNELQALREKYQGEKQAADLSVEKMKEDNATILSSLKKKLDILTQQKESEVTKLTAELALAQAEAKERLEELSEKERSFDLKLEAQKQSLQQMKVYLQQSEDSFKSTEIWRKEVENLNSQVQSVNQENLQIKKEADLTSVRLNSQNEILTIQEQELSKLSDSLPEKKRQCLLSLWRNKVYALMVQLKCGELAEKDSERRWSNKVHNYENALSTCRAQCEVLQHSLHNRQAQLEMEQQQAAKLRRDLAQADEVALRLDAGKKETDACLRQLVQFAHSLLERCGALESQVKASAASLVAYNQRIAFASGRVEMLQSQFARREALLRIQAQESGEELARAAQAEPAEEEEDGRVAEDHGNILQQLLDEVEKVTEERDRLSAQLKADAAMMHEKISTAKRQTVDEVTELRGRLAELHGALEDKTTECAGAAQSLAETQRALDETGAEADGLRGQLEAASMKAERDLQEVRRGEEQRLVEQLAQAEHKVNDARREHTKDIVKVRQMERQLARDKERAAERLAKLEQFYREQSAKLEKRLRAVERDKNVLLNTIRQEGLLAKYQAQRGAPRHLEEEEEEEDSPDGESPGLAPAGPHTLLLNPASLGATQEDEPLHAVIDDLKKLAANVLEDGDPDVL